MPANPEIAVASMLRSTKVYISTVIVVAAGLFATELANWRSQSLVWYVCYLVAGLLMARLKVTLPGINGTLSVNFLFILFGIAQMTLPETLVMASAMTAVQCLWHT